MTDATAVEETAEDSETGVEAEAEVETEAAVEAKVEETEAAEEGDDEELEWDLTKKDALAFLFGISMPLLWVPLVFAGGQRMLALMVGVASWMIVFGYESGLIESAKETLGLVDRDEFHETAAACNTDEAVARASNQIYWSHELLEPVTEAEEIDPELLDDVRARVKQADAYLAVVAERMGVDADE